MNIKKKVVENIEEMIVKEQNRLRGEIRANRYKFKGLEQSQTIMKRQLAELENLRWSIVGKPEEKVAK